MQVSRIVCVKNGDGKKIQIPEQLVVKDMQGDKFKPTQAACLLASCYKLSGLPQGVWEMCCFEFMQDSEGVEYLKIMATNYTICKLICGEGQKNSSLSGGEKLQELKNLRNKEFGLVPEAADEGQGGDESAGSKVKALVHKEPTAAEIDVDGTKVKVLCPSKRIAQSDLMVQIDPVQLDAVFTFLGPDCASLTSTRSYKRSGKYSKAAGKEPSPECEVEG